MITGILSATPRSKYATTSAATPPPKLAAKTAGLNFEACRAIGLLTGRPLLSLPPEANCSGTWILTSSAGDVRHRDHGLALGTGALFARELLTHREAPPYSLGRRPKSA